MLNILTGRSGAGKTGRILQAIRQDAEAGVRAFLIVPEQQTVESERMLATELPPSAQLTVEAVNFTRLADTVFRACGGVSYRYVKKSARPVILWRAMRQVAPAMTEYGQTLGSHGALSTMYAAIRELKSSGVTAASLSAAAESMEEGSRRRRLLDLALLYASYEAHLEEAFADTDDLLAAAVERLRGRDFFRGMHVYFDGFHGFSAGEMALIGEILQSAAEVTVTLLLDGAGSPEFYSTEKTARRLSDLAARHSVSVRREHLGEDLRHGDPSLAYLCHCLWRFSAAPMDEPCESLRLYECADEFDECERVAHGVAMAVRGGRRYGELAIIARDSAKYSGILESALQRYHVPYYFSVRTDLNKMPLVKLISSALQIKNRGFRQEDVIAYLKCGYTGFTDREVDVFEQYLRKWRISDRAFTEPDAFTRYPSGYGELATAADAELLLQINGVRDRLLNTLNPFFATLRAASGAKEMCVAVYEFLESLDVRRRISQEMQAKADDPAAVHALSQLWATVTDALDVIATTLADEPVSGEHFLLLLRTIFDDTDIGTIPPSDDCVTVCDATRMRRGNWHEVFLLGVCDGEFPQNVREGGFFSEADKIALEGEGVVLASREEELSADELLYFYTAASAPSEVLHVSRRRADFAGGERHPSSAWGRIRTLFPAQPILPPPSAMERALTEESAAYVLSLADETERQAILAALGREPVTAETARDVLSAETREALYGGDLYLSNSRIESFVKCRFGYGCRYLLNLREERGPEFSPLDIGNFVHRVLELFLTYLESHQIEFSDLDSGKIDEIADQVIGDYIIRLMGGTESVRMRSLFEKLKRNSVYLIRNLVEEFSVSRFHPRFFELPISASSEVTPTPIRFPLPDGTTLAVGGIADRVDTYSVDGKTYVRIVDYKTGEKEFDYEETLRGLNLQLLIYLFSVCRTDKEAFLRVLGENPTPAGVLYFSAKPPKVELGVEHDVESEEGAALERSRIAENSRRSGMMLADEELILAQDPELSMKYVPKFKVGKDGQWKLSESYRDSAGMEGIFSDITETLRRIGMEMKEGNLTPAPQKDLDPCGYCRYKPVCRSAVKKKR